MLAVARARDAAYDGRFLTGVRTTGIYCLPSCPARPPRPEHVVHFATPADARAAGLRACRRCHPDDHYRGHDPDEQLAIVLGREVAQAPADFVDVTALARRAGVGHRKLHTLFREQWQTTPAAALTTARLVHAGAQLRAGKAPLPASLAAGFEAQTTFYSNFAPHFGMTPAAYRRLATADRFVIGLPTDFDVAAWLALWARDSEGVSERVQGTTVAKAWLCAGVPVRLDIELSAAAATVSLRAAGLTPAARFAAHAAVLRSLNLMADTAGFASFIATTPLAELCAGRPSLRLARTFSAFEAAVWALVGQQVHVKFATTLRRRLIEACGVEVAGLRAHPDAAQLAQLDVTRLRAMQFSQRKAEHVLALAKAVCDGALPLDDEATLPWTHVERCLRAQPGFGPWSSQYVLMRGYGAPDCAPVADTGVRTALQVVTRATERPDAAATERWFSAYRPWRSFVTAHLWASLPARPAVTTATPHEGTSR